MFPPVEVASTPVVISIFVVISIAVVISVVISVAIAVTAGLELSTLAQIAIAGQDLPFIRSAGLQPSQLKRVVVTSTLMVGGPPRLIAARHAIADMVGAGGTGGPVDGCRVTCNVVDSWAVNNADGSFVGGVHGSLRECDCCHQQKGQQREGAFHILRLLYRGKCLCECLLTKRLGSRQRGRTNRRECKRAQNLLSSSGVRKRGLHVLS